MLQCHHPVARTLNSTRSAGGAVLDRYALGAESVDPPGRIS
jgi:hypothetical protein